MNFYLYSAILPLIIIAVVLWFYRPLKIKNISKALLISLIPLSIYMLLIYFLEMENYLNTGWSFYSLMFFAIPYVLISIILMVIARKQ